MQQDSARVAVLYQQAADQGHPDAQFNLASLYGGDHGVQQDSARTASLLQQAIEQGHAVAHFNLALLCRDGHGVQQDSARATALLQQAAEQEFAKELDLLQQMRLEAESKAAAMANKLIRDKEEQAKRTNGKQSKRKKKKAKGNSRVVQVRLPVPKCHCSTVVWQAEAAAAEAPQQSASTNTTLNQRLADRTSVASLEKAQKRGQQLVRFSKKPWQQRDLNKCQLPCSYTLLIAQSC